VLSDAVGAQIADEILDKVDTMVRKDYALRDIEILMAHKLKTHEALAREGGTEAAIIAPAIAAAIGYNIGRGIYERL